MTGAGPPPLLLIAAITAVWAILLLSAFLARAALRTRTQAALAVTATYAALALAVVLWFGGSLLGWVAAAGMAFPLAAALALALTGRPFRSR